MRVDSRLSNLPGVYLILNTATGGFYVGSTLYLRRRAFTHRRKLSLGQHFNKRLQNSYNSNGSASFVFMPILFDDWNTCKAVEQACLDSNCGNEHCYNVALFVDFCLKGRKHTAEARRKIGAANSIANKGHTPSPEHRKKLSEAMKAARLAHPRTISDEAKRKMSLAKIGKRMPWNEAPKSDLTKRRISETKLGLVFTDSDWPIYCGMNEPRKKKFLKERGYC